MLLDAHAALVLARTRTHTANRSRVRIWVSDSGTFPRNVLLTLNDIYKLFYYLNLVKLKHCLGTFLKSLIILQFSQQLLSETLNVSARSTVSPFPPLCAYSRARPFVCMCHRCLEEKRTFPTLLTLVSHVLYVALCRESSEAGLCKVRNSS